MVALTALGGVPPQIGVLSARLRPSAKGSRVRGQPISAGLVPIRVSRSLPRSRVLLGEDPPHEIALGVIGRFWAGETVWVQIDAADFETFAEPGFGKIACNFSLRAYGADRTLVTYECRTQATDETARRGFMRYWRPLAPFIGLVMRSQLRVIETETTSR